ncbi:MAG: ArnT family glycosyltransferase [Bdellovibrionales bacterium]
MLLSADNKPTSRAYLLLALLAALIFWPGQAQLPAVDRDEARFAQATKQMIQTGDYTDIKYQNEHRYKKPVGIYWLQAAAVKLTGAGPADLWAYRLPSYISAIGSVLLTAAIGTLLFGGNIGLLAGIMMAGSLLLNVEARMAKTDATLLFTVLAAQFALLSLWLRRTMHTGLATLFWAALATGVLIKGPMIFLPVGFTLAGLCWHARSVKLLKDLQPLWGLPLMLVLIAPWFVAITMKTGGAFWTEAVSKDLLAKVASGKESHGLPPGYYLITYFGTFWPFAPFIAMALPAVRQHWREDRIFALLAWIIPTWLVFEAVPTKLPHYTLPAFPALAILAAHFWHAGFDAPRWWKGLCICVFCITTAGLLGGFAALPVLASGDVLWPLLLASVVSGIGLVFILSCAMPLLQHTLTLTLVSAIFLTTLFGLALPRWDYIWVARQVENALATQTDCLDPLLVSARFNEPSLVFHVGTLTQLDGTGELAASYISADPCQFALVGKKYEEDFLTHAKNLRIIPMSIAHIRGFSYGGGDRIDMTLYRKK